MPTPLSRELLLSVQKPSRYTGAERGACKKPLSPGMLRFAFCFPDLYEVGMSHLGMKLLYGLLNERADCRCERVFAPDADLRALLRERSIPLFALESGDALSDFDLVGFTLQYEMSFPGVLDMLDLGGIPIYARERSAAFPLVIAGGPCVCNPEPLCDFIDLFVLGEGEEVTGELVALCAKAKAEGWEKPRLLRAAAEIAGVYVPSLYDVSYNEDGTLSAITPREGAPAKIRKRIVQDLDSVYYPKSFVLPFGQIVHDRAVVELFRGCIRGCRFCQAGFTYRPLREKAPDTIYNNAAALCTATGYEELSLSSLSTGDYAGLEPLLDRLLPWSEAERVALSLPSLRIDGFSPSLFEKIATLRRGSFTFAPEAGTQRMRDVINKAITEEDVLTTCRNAFAEGQTAVKLYYMMGLPYETDEDIAGIAALTQKVVDLYYAQPNKPKGKAVQVTISVACFVPKPFTPFQYRPQDTIERFREKQRLLLGSNRSRKIRVNYHDASTSFIEAVLARGDRRLGEALAAVWRAGAWLEGWEEHFSFERWQQAFADCGLDPAFYANRLRSYDELLPWSHLDYGVDERFLQAENERAKEAAITPNCRRGCAGCGAAALLEAGCTRAVCPGHGAKEAAR